MSFSSSSTRNIKIFFAYSQNNQDERLRQALEEQLHLLNSLGVDTKWYKYQIETEQDWEDEICKDLNRADLIVLLVSSTFMHELHEHWNVPVKRATKRYEEEEVTLIPVLLREVYGWQRVLGDLIPLPNNGIAIASSPNRDAAFVEVAQGIVEKVEELKEYQEKLQEYEQHFSEAIQREEPLSEYAREWLNNFKHTWNIKDRDTVLIEKAVTQRQKEYYQQNLQQYEQYLYAAIQQEYPFSNDTRDELKLQQESLNIKDEDIARLEAEITQQREYELEQERKQIFVGRGAVWAVFVVAVVMLGGSFMNGQNKPPSRIPSAASNQTTKLTPNTNDENFDGWIFIGQVKNASDSPTNKKTLIGSSISIDSPVVPSRESEVTVIQSVSLRDNRPQKPNFNPKEQKLLGVIESGQKVIIVDTFVVPRNSSVTSVFAKIRKCNVACN
jgi:hypothetical protein